MTRVSIEQLPAAPLHVLEIWGKPKACAGRLAKVIGAPLPAMGQWIAAGDRRIARFEPTVWLVDGDPAPLEKPLGKDGAITAIGGGLVRVMLRGNSWRRLLMEGGVFDAEDPAFAPGCCATTVIDHVNVRLVVLADDACLALVPSSFSEGLVHFWNEAERLLETEGV